MAFRFFAELKDDDASFVFFAFGLNDLFAHVVNRFLRSRRLAEAGRHTTAIAAEGEEKKSQTAGIRAPIIYEDAVTLSTADNQVSNKKTVNTMMSETDPDARKHIRTNVGVSMAKEAIEAATTSIKAKEEMSQGETAQGKDYQQPQSHVACSSNLLALGLLFCALLFSLRVTTHRWSHATINFRMRLYSSFAGLRSAASPENKATWGWEWAD